MTAAQRKHVSVFRCSLCQVVKHNFGPCFEFKRAETFFAFQQQLLLLSTENHGQADRLENALKNKKINKNEDEDV